MSTTARPCDLVAPATSAASSASFPTLASAASLASASRVTDSASAIVCEITAASVELLNGLELIARLCAGDIGQPLVNKAHVVPEEDVAPVITLHLPVEFAASQHPAWCLACRLACFCPQARVSVLVSATSAFAPKKTRRSSRAAA